MSLEISAAEVNLLVCPTCDQISRQIVAGAQCCPRCGGKVHRRKPRSLSRTTALLITAVLLYIPSNVLPIMHRTTIIGDEDDTIMSGIVALIDSGSWPLAVLVFVASIVVPMLKLLALGALVASIYFRRVHHPGNGTRLYRLVEFIGRWSMLDIYVVTLLVALIQLRALAVIEPRPGAAAFGSVVVLTLLASRSFDPRLLWDRQPSQSPRP